MRLSELFHSLAVGEVHNLFYSTPDGLIKPEKRLNLLNSINLGLTDLYGRFLLKTKQISLPVQEEYIIDDKELIEILNVRFKDLDLVYHLIETNKFKTDIPEYLKEKIDTINICYKAGHTWLTEQDITDDTDISLPNDYLNALLYFVASRLYASIPNQLDGDLQEGMRYAQRYQQEISRLINTGTDVDGLFVNHLFHKKGFI